MLCLYLSFTIQKESERVWRKKFPKGKPRRRLCRKNTEARLQGFLGSEDSSQELRLQRGPEHEV